MQNVRDPAEVERVAAIVRQFIKTEALPRDIHVDDDLSQLGLTSIEMVNLMLAVEAEFDVTFPGSQLIPANFRSIERIAGLVSNLTH